MKTSNFQSGSVASFLRVFLRLSFCGVIGVEIEVNLFVINSSFVFQPLTTTLYTVALNSSLEEAHALPGDDEN